MPAQVLFPEKMDEISPSITRETYLSLRNSLKYSLLKEIKETKEVFNSVDWRTEIRQKNTFMFIHTSSGKVVTLEQRVYEYHLSGTVLHRSERWRQRRAK